MRSGDLKSRLDQAKLLVNSLSNLKGAAMKAGQLLSLDLHDYFPAEAIEILSQLQNAAVALPYEQIESILKIELGEARFRSLKNISTTPIGVASIGQVHKAQYEDQEIALKVQYPDVATSIESDLKILRVVASSFCQLSGRKMDLDPLFTEFKNILGQEVDYNLEAQFQKRYKALVSEMSSDGEPGFRVPLIFEEMCTTRVITMSFEPGLSLRPWLQSNPSKKRRQGLAVALLDLYFNEFFKWGLVQTDPNWTNFLIDESRGRFDLVLLDFGACRTYTHDFIENYIMLLDLASKGESQSLRDHAINFGIIDSRESAPAFLAFEEMLKTAIRPFFVEESGSPYFDFSDPNHNINSQKSAKALAQHLIYSPPPHGLLFLHRKLAGLYSILKSLEVQLDVSGYWRKMRELSQQNI
jgi:aarF domain-containing kinase